MKFIWLGSGRAREQNTSESISHPDLEVPRSRATEFSWTSRFENLKLHAFNLKRYDFHQNRPSELKVMDDFLKFWTKLGARGKPSTYVYRAE